MSREERLYAGLCALWLFMAFAFPQWRLGLGMALESPGSQSLGAFVRVAELMGLLLGAWALARRRPPRAALWAAALWAGILTLAAVRGIHQGNYLKDVAAELRAVFFAPALLALSALPQPRRRLALISALAGAGFFALMNLLVMMLEPAGFSNPNITPVPVPSLDHSLHSWWLLAALGLSLPLWRAKGLLLCVLLWALAWLSFLRGLWAGWILASLAASACLGWMGDWKASFRQLALQAAAAMLSLAALYALLYAWHPDGAYLLKFRALRTLQAAKMLPPPQVELEISPRCSALLRQTAKRGGLFKSLAAQVRNSPSAAESNLADPSLSDRALMRRQALAAFQSSPLLGRGLGTLFVHEPFPGHRRIQRDPHNGFAWILAKAGLAGAVALAVLLLMGFKAIFGSNLPTHKKAALFAVAFLWLTLEWLQAGLLHHEVSLALALLFGVAARADKA